MIRRQLILTSVILGLAIALVLPLSGADATTPADPRIPQLYVVGTAHLDTQWRWTIRQTIEEFIPATLRENFALFEKYPDYVFSFEGSFRYQLMREYYPEEYRQLRDYIRAGRWRVAGSWVDAVDTNLPSPESLIRHVLYGNGFFRREFGVTSRDVFLPDCFGFSFALPSVAAHCGLTGFSTQKLTWGSAIGIPFDIGVWEGVDGSRLIAAMNPGTYVANLTGDQSSDSLWVARAAAQRDTSDLHVALRYFGTGDTGGAPSAESVAWLERSIREGAGPLQVRSVASDQLARDLTAGMDPKGEASGHALPLGLRPELLASDPASSTEPVRQRLATLPHYRGELLMTDHGVGCYTSQSAMKRWNRKNECLADAAERAAAAAHWLGGLRYPREMLRGAWERFLWHQFHDDLTGTSIPEAYVYSWNDELLSLNQFAGVLEDAVGAIARGLETDVLGVPLVVYNPLSIPREDLITAHVRFPGEIPPAVRVYGPNGVEVPSQITGIGADGLDVVFVARVSPVGFAVYAIYPTESPCVIDTGLRATQTGIENRRYRVTIDRQSGCIVSVYDKQLGTEILTAPHDLQMLDDEPHNWAAWEVDYEDLMAAPRAVVGGPAQVRVVENGPALVALEIERRQDGSTFRQRISLAARGAGDRVGIDLEIDWRTPGTLLKAAFACDAAGDSVTYDLGLGTIARGINRPELHEVPAQRWADVPTAGGAQGVAILSESRYGWDHPDRQTLRLTLLHTPVVNEGWDWIEDQATQDLGRHKLSYAIYSHAGDWRQGGVSWAADRLNQPLLAFQPSRHSGELGREFSLLQVESIAAGNTGKKGPKLAHELLVRPADLPAVAVRAIKLAEESDEIIVRLQELHGRGPAEVAVRFAGTVQAVREVNGAEEPLDVHHGALYEQVAGKRTRVRNGAARVVLGPYQPKTLALKLLAPSAELLPPSAKPLLLDYDLDGISSDGDRSDGDFDGHGHTLVSELLPRALFCGGVPFLTGPRGSGESNLVTCRGQALELPGGEFDQLYLLAASAEGDRRASFVIEVEDAAGRGRSISREIWIQDYAEPIGQWDSRVLGRELIRRPEAIVPGYVKPQRVGWIGTHRHSPDGANEAYQFTYLFVHRLELPAGARRLRLPRDERIRIAAVTVAGNENAATMVAQPLFDRTERTAVNILAPLREFVGQMQFELASPNRGAAVHYTLDGSDPTEKSARYEGPIRLTETTTVKARALAGRLDDAFVAEATFTRRVAREADAVAGGQPGLVCRYYEGAWEALPDFSTLTPARTEVVAAVGLPAFARQEEVGLVFEGFVRVPAEGIYAFHLWSDDGSALFVGGEQVVDNDGLHGNCEKWAHVALAAGAHPVRVEFFQHLGGVSLDLRIAGPGIESQVVPETWWLHRGE